jgi:hypothetical protein
MYRPLSWKTVVGVLLFIGSCNTFKQEWQNPHTTIAEYFGIAFVGVVGILLFIDGTKRNRI